LEETIFQVAAYGSCDIPFTFTPHSLLQDYNCVIEIRQSDKPIVWKFPVLGIPETVARDSIRLACRARMTLQRDIPIVLSELNVQPGTSLFLLL
jgi:hypothetical protein